VSRAALFYGSLTRAVHAVPVKVLDVGERPLTRWLSGPKAEGWKAYLDDDDRAVLFCPECAEREFGDPDSAVPAV